MDPRKFKFVQIAERDLENLKKMLRIRRGSTESADDKSDDAWLVPTEMVTMLVAIATNAWRARAKMTDPVTGEVRDEMQRVGRHIEAIFRNLAELGIAVRDHTGESYDEGQPMKVIASKPTPGLDKKRISETLLPSIFWYDRLIQNGEIEIAVPLRDDDSVEPDKAE